MGEPAGLTSERAAGARTPKSRRAPVDWRRRLLISVMLASGRETVS